MALVGLLPVGELKLLKKAGDKIEEIANKYRKSRDGKLDPPNCPTLPRRSVASQVSYAAQAVQPASDKFPPIFCDRDAELEALGPFTGKTLGRARSGDGRKWDQDELISGMQKRDAELIDWVKNWSQL
ncbi:hypothetical protein ACFYNX_33180 [Streptomyces sp. NPDC007872]|uniref:hypothetical protein n=1 Tax=Streptomyces sp. NPDC007872 TaxID=3364782 RepID=UPI0036B8B6F7